MILYLKYKIKELANILNKSVINKNKRKITF